MTAPLYALTKAYQSVWDMVSDDDADLGIIEDTLQAIEGAIETKAASIVSMARTMDASADAIDLEIKRLQARKRALNNKADAMRQYLQRQLETAGIEKVKTDLFTISIVNNPPAVNITDEKAIPAAYLTIIPEQYQPNKKLIADAIKGGVQVPGAELVQGRRLSVR